jgi:hypothetical protein
MLGEVGAGTGETSTHVSVMFRRPRNDREEENRTFLRHLGDLLKAEF